MNNTSATQLPKTKTNPASNAVGHSKSRLKKNGEPFKTPVNNDKLLKSGTYMTVASKKHPSREDKVTLWEVWLPNWKGEVTHRDYEVRTERDGWYYGPQANDKIGDKNSCLAMATRRFENPNAVTVYAQR